MFIFNNRYTKIIQDKNIAIIINFLTLSKYLIYISLH